MNTSERNSFQLSYQVSPIVLTGGIATNISGAMLPIINLLQAQDYGEGPLGGSSSSSSLDDYFAQFIPLPGSTLIDNQLGTYPFANQTTAANAIIAQPLAIALMMICPVRGSSTYAAKRATITNLQSQLAKHSSQGGTYTIVTPSFVYTNCILTTLRDVSDGEARQPQIKWQWEFVQPLLTVEAAQAAQNSLMAKMSNGTEVKGDPPSPSGQDATVADQASLAGPSVVPAARPLVGSSSTSVA